jgi:serine/threonine protein kinase
MVRDLQSGDPRQIGPYRLIGQLGCGGMGRVFLGLSAGGRPVAVKAIRAELAADPEFRVRFGREVAAARRVSGLFTALVVDADVDGPVPWLATAYVAGPSLSEAVTSYGPMSSRPALALAAGLAEGLSAIHAVLVVHCDLKPSNVLLSQDGPRVIDFGISRAAEAVPVTVTGPGIVVGSPGFMSPEQALGEDVGPPSDVFSLGAVLAFATTGQGPFGEGSGPALAYRLVYSQPSLDQVPAELRSLVERCLAKEPSQRPTADEVLAEVGALQPVAGWLPEAAISAFAQEFAPLMLAPAARSAASPAAPGSPAPDIGHSPAPGPGQVPAPDIGQVPAPVPVQRQLPGRDRTSRPLRHRLRRPLIAAAITGGVIAASVGVSFALTGAAKHPDAGSPAPQVVAGQTTASPASSAAGRRVPAVTPPSSSPGANPVPDILPAVDVVMSPGTPAGPSPSAAASKSPIATPSPTVSRSPSTTPSPSPSTTPSPSASATPPPPVPRIKSAGTYRKGLWVYFDVHYANPGHDAVGFGFMGANGSRWVEDSYLFASPGRGIVGPGSVAYPLDLECGTAKQHRAEIEAWIYDTAGASSRPVVISLSCKA